MPKRKKASKGEATHASRTASDSKWSAFAKQHSVLLLFCLACTIAGLYEVFSPSVQGVEKADLYMKPEKNLVAIYGELYPTRSSAHYGHAYQSLMCSDVEFANTPTCSKVDSTPSAFRQRIEDAIAAGDRSSESLYRAHVTALLRDGADEKQVADAVRAWRVNHPYSKSPDPRTKQKRVQQIDGMLALKKEALRLYAECQQSNWSDRALLEQTEAVLRQILALNPKDGVAYAKLGVALLKSDQLDESISCLERAIDFEPNDVGSIKLLSQIHHQREEVDKALRYCKLAVDTDGEDAVARLNLGRISAHTGNMPEAESQLRKAIQIAANAFEAHNLLALVLIEQGRYDEAVKTAKIAVDLSGGSNRDCLSTLATAYERADDRDNAVRVRRQLESL